MGKLMDVDPLGKGAAVGMVVNRHGFDAASL